MKLDILIVDDSLDMLEVLSRQLSEMGHNCYQSSNVVDAVELLKTNIPDLLITDIQMPGVDGVKLVKYSFKHFPAIPVLVITGFPSLNTAVEVMRNGAVDYLTKPFTRSELEIAINNIQFKQHQEKSKNVKAPVISQIIGLVGESKALNTVKHLIAKTTNNQVTVLITGESGTGKELVARAIHYSGKFAQEPFIAVNCGAIPENLLESELFGYEKGAFTGAQSDREGLFHAANGGTIFLDEIGNAPPSVQQRLLRVIQEKEVTRVGSRKPAKINVRIIAATNSSLTTMVKNGEFREDLYYRLNVINIEVPTLSSRKDDIPILVNHFIAKHSKELGKHEVTVHPESIKILSDYSWPGNIRELENTIQRAMVLADNSIMPEHLPISLHAFPTVNPKSTNSSSLASLKEIEKNHILHVLESVNNNKTKAASILGITRKTLLQKIQ